MSVLVPLSAFLLYISMPNPLIFMPFGIFFSFVPIFIMNIKTRGRNRFFQTFIFASLFAVLALVPRDAQELSLANPETIILILMFISIAFIYSISFYAASYSSDIVGWKFSPIFYGSFWMIAGFLMYKYFILPPFPLETSLVRCPTLIQSARYFGTFPITFMIIATNMAIALIILENDRRYKIYACSILLLVHTTNACYGSVTISSDNKFLKDRSLSIIQPAISTKEYELMNSSRLFEKLITDRLMYLSKMTTDHNPDLIVWPELSGNFTLQDDEKLKELTRDIASERTDILIGTSYMDYTDGSKKNIAFVLKMNGDISGPYFKQRMFPFSESRQFSAGGGMNVLSTSFNQNIGVMICLESLYPSIAKREVRSGADLLVSISNDASFGNSMIPYIHSAEIVFRAIENDKYGVHVGNTGPSIICDNKGRILTYIKYGIRSYGVAMVRI